MVLKVRNIIQIDWSENGNFKIMVFNKAVGENMMTKVIKNAIGAMKQVWSLVGRKFKGDYKI